VRGRIKGNYRISGESDDQFVGAMRLPRIVVGLARLSGKVTPHTLRHTAAAWLMQRSVPIWEAAGFLGMSPEVLQDTYGHHHPDHLHGAAAAIGQKDRYVSVAKTVATLTEDRNEKKKLNEFWSEWQDLNLRPLRPERK
jgi:integrase